MCLHDIDIDTLCAYMHASVLDGERIMMVAVLSVLSKYDNVRPLVQRHFHEHSEYLLQTVNERLYDANEGTWAKGGCCVTHMTLCMC